MEYFSDLLKIGRSSCLVHRWKDKCYILGGLSYSSNYLPLEIFDLQTKESSLDENMTISSYGSGSILIEIEDQPFIFASK